MKLQSLGIRNQHDRGEILAKIFEHHLIVRLKTLQIFLHQAQYPGCVAQKRQIPLATFDALSLVVPLHIVLRQHEVEDKICDENSESV
jgi:hypothetical protein